MSIFNYAYCQPIPLDGYVFGADFDLEWTGSQFTAKWSDFVLSDADNLARVGDVISGLIFGRVMRSTLRTWSF